MKKTVKKLACLLIVAVLCLCGSMSALAEGRVTYLGRAEKFIFEPGSEYSPSDMFENFKGVMPGDTLTQPIVIRNQAEEKVKIRLYMRALGAHPDSVDFLSQLSLRVEQNGDSILFDASADQTAQLSDWVYLGTIYSGGTIDLNVLLDVPVDLPNEFQNAIGYLDWQFKIEELPVEDTDPKPPKTGDYTVVAVAITTCVAAAGLFVLLLFFTRRRKESE